MPALVFSAGLDTNIPIVEEFPDGLKATAYFEDYLFKLFQDIENINVLAGPAYGVIEVTGQPTLTAAIPTETIEFIEGTSISLVTAEGAPDSITFINDDPFPEAPIDGNPYGRRDAAWIDLNTLFIPDAPSDGNIYGRLNGAWENIDAFGLDHGGLAGLADDDHAQYLLLAGRAGGQTAFGGTASAEELVLRGSTDAQLGIVRIQSPIRIDDVTAQTATVIDSAPTLAIAAAFNGSFLDWSATMNVSNSTFIMSTVKDSTTINFAVDPFFAIHTLFDASPIIQNDGDFDLIGSATIFAQQNYRRITSGTSTINVITGMNLQYLLRAQISGGILELADSACAIIRPVFGTFAGATVDFGTVRGLWLQNIIPGFFQPSLGTELIDAYIGVEVDALPFGGDIIKVAVRSALTLASNTRFLLNTGGADSDFGTGDLHFDDDTSVGFGGAFGASDMALFWDATNDEFIFSTVDGVGGNPMALVGGADDVWIFRNSAAGGVDIGFQINTAAITFGTVAPIPGAVDFFTRFASPSGRTPSAGATFYHDFEVQPEGFLDVNGEALNEFDTIYVETPVLLFSGGSATNVSNLHLDGMANQFSGTRRQALRVLGRTRMDGVLCFNEVTLTQLTADVAALALPLDNLGRYVHLQDADAMGPWNIQGIVNIQVGDSIVFVNDGANAWNFTHQDAAAAAADRIITPTGVAFVIGPDETACLWYDPVATRWRILWGTGA